MSNKSRARLRYDPDAAERKAAAEEQTSKWERMSDAFGRANTVGGLRELVGLALEDRKEATAAPKPAAVDPEQPRVDLEAKGLREPTQYERAVLVALGQKQVYGGTAEPARVAERRRRNKAARAARKGRQRKQRGKVLISRFGYPIHVPGISQ